MRPSRSLAAWSGSVTIVVSTDRYTGLVLLWKTTNSLRGTQCPQACLPMPPASASECACLSFIRSPYHICNLIVEGSPTSKDSGFSTFFSDTGSAWWSKALLLLEVSTFFSETGSGKHVPRYLYIDLESGVTTMSKPVLTDLFSTPGLRHWSISRVRWMLPATVNWFFVYFDQNDPHRCSRSLHRRLKAYGTRHRQIKETCEQLLGSPKFLCLPLVWWWDWF